ncbi:MULTISPECIES: prepilin-type N-terminal cleavage/methylation domain-containing protein [unclassified Nostoc]|uniref:prepilin-type N-terminal cleavage/methylation domain-containing protein n=1 Tax=unclassified Nostoc TaxID=2593658 RepID=UPI00261FDE7F|nr:prepilin-type N-terminal cleavage/methylation domain-containing protein [Nostoc sp. S13]MDF5735119.1 prepilin-type N-terminal cleavage/methylation domain-containing protein [Nostoc sp. S13]
MIKRKQQQVSQTSDEPGFTIIESLVALLVVAILLTAIAPVIVLATATRVQSRRVELATQAAKTFIDGIRTGAITAPSAVTTLTAPTSDAPRRISDVAAIPAVAAVAATGSTPAIPAVAAIPAVTGRPQDYLINTTNMAAPTSATGLYCFNQNGTISTTDCSSNQFYIQAGQIIGVKDGYRLGIRVYRADADFPLIASTVDTKYTQTPFTAGLGSRKAPLIEMTTDISNTTTTFQALCQRLGTATNQSCQ